MFPKLTPITRNIIILNVIFYLVSNFVAFPKFYELFSVYYIGSPFFRIWQVITPVSYTHLDVYKRQKFIFSEASSDLHRVRARRSAGYCKFLVLLD